MKSAPLVGRREELAALDELLDHVIVRRHPHMATVFGLPGVGKSRLAVEFGATVPGRGGRTIRGRSLPYGESGVYGAFAQQIKQLAEIPDSDSPILALEKVRRTTDMLLGPEEGADVGPHLAMLLGVGPVEATADRHTLFLAARRFVEALAAEQPTVLVFEDLQWADPSLLDLLEHLASRIRDAPLMMLVLARPDFLAERPNWGAGLPAYTALPLEPLSVDESRELARRLLARTSSDTAPEAAIQLAETGEGNPLFIEELVASLAERAAATAGDLPTSIRGIVAARLDALSAGERSALLAASIVGKIFWRGSLVSLNEDGEELDKVLDRLEGRDLIRREHVSRIRGEEQFRFKHMLIRDVAYATLPRVRRREGHGVVAVFLEKAGVGGVSLAVLAHHWREAGDEEKAVNYLVAAAEQARRGWAKQEAVRYYREALKLLPKEDSETQEASPAAMRSGRADGLPPAGRRMVGTRPTGCNDRPTEHVTGLRRLAERAVLAVPSVLRFQLERRLHAHAFSEGVQHDAVLLGASKEAFGSFAGFVCGHNDPGSAADRREADRELPAHGKGSSRIPVALDLHIELLEVNRHVRGDHPQRDLLAGGERPEQQVARAGDIALASDRFVGP